MNIVPSRSGEKARNDCWDCCYQFSEMSQFSQEVARLKGQKVLRSLFEGVFEIVIVILLVKLCLLITLIKYLKGHKSLALLKIITCMCKIVSPFTSQFFCAYRTVVPVWGFRNK